MKIGNNGNLVLGPFDESTPCLMIVLMNCQTKLRINHLTAVKSVAILESNANLNFYTWKKITLYMPCAKPCLNDFHFKIEEYNFEVVDCFTYLGSGINNGNDCTTEIQNRTIMANKRFNGIRKEGTQVERNTILDFQVSQPIGHDVVPVRISSQSTRHCWRSPLTHAFGIDSNSKRLWMCSCGVQQTKKLPHAAKVDVVWQLGCNLGQSLSNHEPHVFYWRKIHKASRPGK
ncbi:alpha-2 adrenergic receptor [Trichonephila clavipes]|nr:alpha-2 adrenergic receptor [Trichonephila clavipes]